MDFLKEVEKNLDLPLAEKKQVMKELDGHYCDLREELLESGMSASQADQEAARKLGDPADIAQKMQSIHCQLGWKTAFIMALPVIALACFRLLSRVFQLFRRPVVLTPGGPIPGQLLHSIRLETLTTGAVALAITVIFLYPAIRDWRAGRRPVWLATWMAGGMCALSYTLSSVLRFFYQLHPSSMTSERPATLLNLSILLVLGIFCMWLLKELPRWRNFTAVITAFGIVALLDQQLLDPKSMNYPWYLIWIYGSLLVHPLLLVPAGIGGFGRRPYGNAAQASLFLWTCCGANFVTGSSNSVPWMAWISYIVGAVVIIAAVFAYARQTSWMGKTYAIAAAMVAVALINLLPSYYESHYDMNFSIQQAMLLLWSIFFVIVVPVLYGVKQSKQRPQAV